MLEQQEEEERLKQEKRARKKEKRVRLSPGPTLLHCLHLSFAGTELLLLLRCHWLLSSAW